MKLLCPRLCRLILWLFLQPVFPKTSSAWDHFSSAARSAGLAYAAVALTGPESLLGNPAGLAGTDQLTLLLTHESRFLLREFSVLSAGVVFPLLSGFTGISCSQFGNSVYREQLVSLSMARKFGDAFVASVRFKRGTLHFPQGYDRPATHSFECGMLIRIAPSLRLGLHMADPFSLNVSNFRGPGFLQAIRIGKAWHISSDLLWSTELEKLYRKPLILKTGMEYQAGKQVLLRAGFNGHPFMPAGGVGFIFGRKVFDLGFSYHITLGFTPVSSVTVRL